MARVTAVVIARDEERHLGACLDALSWADERLVVLDDRTTDRSAAIAASRGVPVSWQRFQSFPRQRNAALNRVQTPWVLFVDADERTTPSLANEIREAVDREAGQGPAGYWIPRRNFIWGSWIRHGGWFPDYQLRLLAVGRARYDEERDVHELVALNGPAGYLQEALIHYNYDTVAQFLAKQGQYSTLEATRLARSGTRARPHHLVLQPYREFRRRFVELEGYRDGWRGLALAALLAWYTMVTYARLGQVALRSKGEEER